jgi:hypothetical protein
MDPPTQVTPSKLEVDFDKNITKLYEAITSCRWNDAIAIAKSSPKEAATWVVRYYETEDQEEGNEIMWRFLPIHSACARQPPAAVISALLQAYPDGAKCIDDQGMYALHYACGNQASREVIRLLLMTFNEAAKMKDPRGMLPIHYLACWGPSSVSVIDMVLVANRDVADVRDEDGNTPMALAMESEYPERTAVIAALRRWLENTNKNKPATLEQSSTQKRAFEVAPTPAPVKKSIEIETHEEKKETEADDVDATEEVPSPLTVGRLRQEITKLNADQRKLETTWESRMEQAQASWTAQKDAMEAKVKQLEAESAESSRQIANLQADVQEKDYDLKITKSKLVKAEASTSNTENELDGLRSTLADLTENHDNYKRRANMMHDRLGSLNASLISMMEQQNKVLSAMKAREASWSALAKLRKSKVEELLNMETEVNIDDMDLQTVVMKQTKEMEAITAVIAAVRSHE